ncbi:MAG: exodeoxyribonuclease V subunit beta [Deltaproteobacteria bacterium]|jgi:exodeoxyribonuclease V beta subunit|nr:exodeoxyribonuclease V subunit beta [Deltaproteobacteria bacterium]
MAPYTCQPSQPSTFDLVRSPLAGINLIDASAGTGKTYTICGLVLRLLLEKNLAMEQILVVTYTEAATEDLHDRIRQQLRQALDAMASPTDDQFLQEYLATIADREKAARSLSDALRSFDEAAIYTIHGFCQRMLLEHSFESNTLFDTELIPDDSVLVKEIIEDFWRRTFSDSSELFSRYAAAELAPEALQHFLAPLLPHPFLKLIPAVEFEAGCNSLLEAEEEYIETYRNVCREWSTSRSEICSDLLHSPGLKRNIYNNTALTGIITSMDVMAAACAPSTDLFEKFNLLTSGRIKAGTKINEKPHILPFYQHCQDLAQIQDNLLTRYGNCLLALKKRLLESLPNELNSRKARDNVFSFDDLLRRLHKALTGAAGSYLVRAIARKYPAALIDEFQDTDPLQYEIFKTIYRKDSLLFLIGDPKQAIYSFRGADIHTYMDAAAGSALAHHTLRVNYRSDPRLVKAINTIFCRAENPFIYEAISFQPVAAAQKKDRKFLTIDGQQESPFIIWHLERNDAMVETPSSQINITKIPKTRANDLIIPLVTAEVANLLKLASENRALIKDRKLVPGDIAILVRKNEEARRMQQALARIRIPSVLHSGDALFASAEAKEMLLLLEAIAVPGSIRKLKTALLTCFIGLPANVINLLQTDRQENAKTIEFWLTRFKTFHDLWNGSGFMRMFWTVMQENRVRRRVLASENGERVLTNILHLAEILHQESVTRRLNMTALLGYLQNRLAEEQTGSIEHQLRLESDEDRVKIVTIHKAKGLEYPIVFCPFAWEGTRLQAKKGFLFHQKTTGGKTELYYDAGSDEFDTHLHRARQEEMAENLRLLYVALTRAVHRCYLAWGAINGAETSAPAFLLHQYPASSENSGLSDPGQIDLMAKAAERFSGLSDQKILTDLQNLAAASGSTIRIITTRASTKEELPKNYIPESQKHVAKLRCRRFTGTIPADRQISSFSSLIRHRSAVSSRENHALYDEAPDRDTLAQSPAGPENLKELQENRYDIFTFPQGAKPGTLLHELLEQADFGLTPPVPENLICEKLRVFGYETAWHTVVAQMLENLGRVLLHHDIPGLKLSSIPRADCLYELEFYYPLTYLTPADLKQIFCSGDLRQSVGKATAYMDLMLDRLAFTPARGFMRGFIDLVFEFEGKFYLADWKSNHLGASIENYSLEKVKENMLSGYYFLQYHLYCLALHLYLGKRLPGYRYESHFGGVFYIFLRGVNQERGPDYGIYHDRPAVSTVEMLRTRLLG